MNWRVGGNWCKSKPTRALSCSVCPFSQSRVLVAFVKSPGFAALTNPFLCSAWPAQPLPPAPISPSAARQAAWSPAPRRHFLPLCVEKFCEQEVPLQLLQFTENPQPLHLPFSWVHALHGPQLKFGKHFVSSKLWSHSHRYKGTQVTPSWVISSHPSCPFSPPSYPFCPGGMSWEEVSFAPRKSVGKWPLAPEMLHGLSSMLRLQAPSASVHPG